MNEEIKLTKRKPTWNYILNDLALYSLMTKVIHSECATYQEKFDLMYQIELLQKQNQDLKEELETKINDIKEDDAYDRTEFQAGMLFAFEEMLNKITISVNQEDVQNIINCYEKDIKYIKQLEGNWNELKEWLEEYIENIKMQYQNSEPTRQYSLQVIKDTLQVTIDKIQEIESRK